MAHFSFWSGSSREKRLRTDSSWPKQHGAAPQPHEEDTREGAYHVLEGKVLGYTGFPKKQHGIYQESSQPKCCGNTLDDVFQWFSMIWYDMFVQRVLQIMKLPILVVQKQSPLVLYSLSWFHSMTRKISGTKGPNKRKQTIRSRIISSSCWPFLAETVHSEKFGFIVF